MATLQVIYGLNPIFIKKAEKFEKIDDEAKELAKLMLSTMYHERAVGIAGNMVGVLKRIITVDLFEDGKKNPIIAFNPEIIMKSEEMQTNDEASLSFPGVAVNIKRPLAVKMKYLNEEGYEKVLEANGFLAAVLQHEIDYLDGITIFDHMSKMKRDMMIKKMEKYIKSHPPHIHSSSCNH